MSTTTVNTALFLGEMKLAAQKSEQQLSKADTKEEIALHEGFSLGLIRAFRIFQSAAGETYDITGWFNTTTEPTPEMDMPMNPTIPTPSLVSLIDHLESYAHNLHSRATGALNAAEYHTLTTRSTEVRKITQILQDLVNEPDIPVEDLPSLGLL